jgi:Na+/proline symporter
VLSASTIALALLADATGFGPQTTTLALVLLPVVLFLGIAAGIVVLVGRAAEAATTAAVVAGAVAFLVVWAALFRLQRRTLDPLRRTTPRFPTPPDQA